MTQIIEYQCDICRNKYKTEEQALNCENRGLFDFSKYPIGLIYKRNWENNQCGIFCIADNRFSDSKHFGEDINWAYRSWENYSDDKIDLKNFPKCGDSFISDYYIFQFKKEDLELEHTKWMINQLKLNDIQPSCYIDNKLIKL